MKSTEDIEKKEIQSVARAIKIIDFIAKHQNTTSLTEISRGLDLSKSTVHGLISTLEKYDYVYQDQGSGLYQLGLKLFELGQVVHGSMDLRNLAYPFMVDLRKKHEETIHLAVLSGAEVVYIEKVDSLRSVRIISQIGGRNPTYCTGVGKVLLSGLSDAAVERMIEKTGMKKITPYTIDSIDKLKDNLAEIRRKGYAYDSEEIEVGLRCIAAPVRNHKGVVIAAISLSGPIGRMPDERLGELSKDVVEAARAISKKMGCRD